MGFFLELSFWNIGLAITLFLSAKLAYKYFQKLQAAKKLEKWNHIPPDKLIVHVIPACKDIVSASPFVLKVLTYLRITNIPYEIDTTEPFGPLGKTPWISLNGKHVPDSHFIIEFLNKKFDKDISKSLSDHDRGIGRSVRIMLENHTFWGIAYWRWVENYFSGINRLFNFSLYQKVMVWLTLSRRVKAGFSFHGLSGHSPDDLHRLVQEDLRTVSSILGKNKFIVGNQVSEDDCAIFGFLAECLWAFPGSPYEQIMKSKELSNLPEYCERMKSIYWPDWENHLLKV